VIGAAFLRTRTMPAGHGAEEPHGAPATAEAD
jgi:hypothetical protein